MTSQSQIIPEFIDISDPRLFGSETADTEEPNDLEKYFVESEEFRDFLAITSGFCVARARKGVGKSALLKHALSSFSRSGVRSTFITGGHILSHGELNGTTTNELLRDWRATLCRAALEIVAQEILRPKSQTELAILRKVKPIGRKVSIFARLVSIIRFNIPFVSSSEIGESSSYELLKQYLEENNIKVALVIDDVDATFRPSEKEKLSLGAFFTSARLLSGEISNFLIRASVRSDVWTTISRSDEALDKCEQHITDISWSYKGTRAILGNRIRRYLSEKEELTEIKGNEGLQAASDDELIDLIFVSVLPWGTFHWDNFRVLHRLSAGRPRWALQLCKMATAELRKTKSNNKVTTGLLSHILPSYSKFRIGDIVKEHRHQCENIEDIVMAFDGAKQRFSTTDVLSYIQNRVCRFYQVAIDGDKAEPQDIASFLYRIGFLEATNTKDRNEHMEFSDYPHFFVSLSADHSYVNWDINPSFRAALHL